MARSFVRRTQHSVIGATVQEVAFIQGMHHLGSELWQGVILRDPVKVRVAVLAFQVQRLARDLGAAHGSLHELDQVRHSSKEKLVVVRVAVDSFGAHTLESPTVGLANEATELGVIKVRGDDLHFKLTRLVHFPAASMRHPANDISKLGSR